MIEAFSEEAAPRFLLQVEIRSTVKNSGVGREGGYDNA
jgi:hypothetical protein